MEASTGDATDNESGSRGTDTIPGALATDHSSDILPNGWCSRLCQDGADIRPAYRLYGPSKALKDDTDGGDMRNDSDGHGEGRHGARMPTNQDGRH